MQMVRGSAGFSLVEMMIAVAVLFIISGIAISAYSGYTQTAREQTLMAKVEAFRMFQDNWRIDNGSYLEGDYVPDGTNDFEAMGYRIAGDRDGISLNVEACDGGAIEACYKVTATDSNGNVLVWQNGAYTWP